MSKCENCGCLQLSITHSNTKECVKALSKRIQELESQTAFLRRFG